MLDHLPLNLQKDAPGVYETSIELLKNTSRIIVIAMGGGIVLWQLLEGSIHSERVAEIFPIGLFFGGLCFLVMYLLDNRIILSQVIWQVGIFIGITLLLYVYQRPDLVYLYSFLPLMAVIMLGWKMALIVAAGGYGLLFLVVKLGVITTLTEDFLPGVLLGMSLAGFIGWAGMRSMLTQVGWSFSAYQQAAIKVREAQEQRLELVQTQEDLLQANRELARLSDRLRLMTSAAEEARKVKEEFVANVSHELRTPLNMIIGFSEVILRSPRAYGTKLPETLLADIAAIQRNSQHLVGLVNDVLALSQADTGHLILMRDWCILQDIVREAVEAVRVFYESKKLYLETDLPDDPLSIFCDSLRIREVILNLLSNAGRFTDKGGVRMRVWVNDGNACVSVTDTGPGIAEEDQERIFEPFQQLDSSIRKKNTGTGLGLTISKRFIEMHDGKMWLESVPLQGTTFYFSIPVQPKIESSASVKKRFVGYRLTNR